MTGAMYAAIAGLKTHMNKMNVIGNNIANVNTAGYKTQRTVFKDAMYTMYSSGSDGTEITGGTNPAQIGYGSMISSIDLNMSTGTYTPGIATDCMIYGDGFFLVGDKTIVNTLDPLDPNSSKNLTLTRVGDFSFKADGYLSDSSGSVVYGFLTTGVDPETGNPIVSDQLVPIRLPRMETVYLHGDEVIDQDEYNEAKATAAAGTKEEKAQFEAEYSVKYEIRYPEVEVDDDGNATQMHDYRAKTADGTLTGEILPYAQLDSVTINAETGAITGTTKDTDELITIGYIAIGNVTNPNGVTHADGFYYTAGEGAGDLQVSLLGGVANELGIEYVNGSLYAKAVADYNEANPDNELDEEVSQSDILRIGSAGGTNLMTGGLEGSNVDIATEISEMITTQRGYQANTRIITVTDTMLEELVNIKR